MIDCYYCKEFHNIVVDLPDILNPFCNEREQAVWAQKHYGKRGAPKSVKELQAGLLQMGKRADLPVGKLFDWEDEPKANLDH